MTISRNILLSAAFLALFSAPSFAAVPDDVMSAYKSYMSAMDAQDYKQALKDGKTAWQRAEKSMGDSKTTGDLAFNYGFLEKARGDAKKSIKALERSIDLAMIERDTGNVRLEREVELVAALEAMGDSKGVSRRVDSAMGFANQNGLSQTVFAGELLFHETNACNARASRAANQPSGRNQTGSRVNAITNLADYVAGIQSQCAKTAKQALDIFALNPATARPAYIASASNSIGYAKERAGDFLGAALAYQQSRAAIEDKMGRNDPLVAHTIGRWVNARARLDFTGELDAATTAGLKDMWPYKLDTPKVRVTQTAAKDTGGITIKTNRGSGYAIMQVDVDDAGMPTNVRVLDSWPGDAYVRESERKLESYRFAPKTGDEPEGYRKDVTVPFTYTIFDRENQDVY